MKKNLFRMLVLVLAMLIGMGATASAFTFADAIAWDGEYDVIVAGFGGAGSIAAKNAADAGARVLLLEKAPEGGEGGNTRVCGQLFVYGNEDYEATLSYYKRLSGNHAAPDAMLEVYAESIAKMCDVVADELSLDKANFKDWTGDVLGAMSPEYPEFPGADKISLVSTDGAFSNAALWNAMRKVVTDRADKIDVWFESPAISLIQDPQSKTVLGVQVGRGGKTLNIRAKNGVVLTTGGFENNKEMVANYLGLDEPLVIGSLYNTGDGVRMALDAGADLWHMEVYEGIAMAGGSSLIPNPGEHARMFSIPSLLTGSAVIVAEDGTRFLKEDEGTRHGHVATGGVWMNPRFPKRYFSVVTKDQYDQALEAGLPADYAYTFTGDTLDALAETASINADTLKTTIEHFNLFAEQGIDYEMGRSPATMKAFGEGPYYAVQLMPSILNTQGGPRRNEHAEVIDRDGNPIPRLYSAGELGGICSLQYQGGGNIAECFIFGAIAGKNAAAEKDALPEFVVAQPMESNLTYLPGATSDIAAATEVPAQVASDELIGEASGMGGAVKVKVTLDGDKITAIEIVEHNETPGIADPAIEAIPARILEAQSTQVDGIAGATVTSNAIKAAVDAALTK